MILKKAIKRLIYGTIPYAIASRSNPESPNLRYYKYIKEHGYARHLYEFRHEYDHMVIDVQKDEEKDLYYVMHNSTKKLYFHRGFKVKKIKRLYKALVMEQDIRSPHHYMNNINEVKGKTFLDIGSAEGLTSLDVIDEVRNIYMFEQDEQWIEALQATFEPWKDKVTIVRKYISNYNDENHQTLDDFFKDKPKDNLFLKMDIEGEERNALAGCDELFRTSPNLCFAICTYHLPDDEEVISSFLDKYKCEYTNQKGYFIHKLRSVVLRGWKV